MKRLHVHAPVDGLDKSLRFCSGMCGAEPAVVKTDYARWMPEDSRVNFAFSRRGAGNGLNHLGIQAGSAAGLDELQSSLASLQPDVKKQEEVRCCHARADKHWVTDPSGIARETFDMPDRIPVFGPPDKTRANRAASHRPGRECNRAPTVLAAPHRLPPKKAQPAANVESEND